MTQTTTPSPPMDRAAGSALRRGPWENGWRRHAVLVAAQLIVGLALVVLAAVSDLSTVGRLVAVALAILLTLVLVVMTGRESDVWRGIAALLGGIIGVSASPSSSPTCTSR